MTADSKAIKLFRKSQNLSQTAFGAKYVLHHTTIRRYEKGTRSPEFKLFVQMANDAGYIIEMIVSSTPKLLSRGYNEKM